MNLKLLGCRNQIHGLFRCCVCKLAILGTGAYQGSLIYKHSNETGHEFDFDNPKVLNSSKFTGTRKYLESFYSVVDQNSINRFI